MSIDDFYRHVFRHPSGLLQFTARGFCGSEDATLPEIERAAREGLILTFASECEVLDLAEFEGFIESIIGLETYEGTSLRSTHLLLRASALEILRARDVGIDPDLSGLPNLQEATIDPSLKSVLRNPNLRQLVYFTTGSADRITAPLEALNLNVSHLDGMDFLEDGTSLEDLAIYAKGKVDVRGIDRSERLRRLWIDARHVVGIQEIQRVPTIEQLGFMGTQNMPGFETLAELNLDELSARPNYLFDEVFMARAKGRTSEWEVGPLMVSRVKNGTVPRLPLKLKKTGALYDLCLTDWDAVDARLTLLGIDSQIDGYKFEEFATMLEATGTSTILPDEYDTESDGFHIVSADEYKLKAIAKKIQAAWKNDALLRDAFG